MADADNTANPTLPPDPGGGIGRRNERRARNKHRNSAPDTTKFKGKNEQLKGFVYDVTTENPTESFQRTTSEIAEYVARTLEDAGEYRLALAELKLPPVKEAVVPTDPTDIIAIEKWRMDHRDYLKKMENRKKNQGRVFPIILGQCSAAMRDQLESDPMWEGINNSTDVIGLLQLIQANSNVKQPRRARTHQLIDAQKEFLTFTQGSLSVPSYFKSFKDRLDQLERMSGPVGQELTRVDLYLKEVLKIPEGFSAATVEQVNTARDVSRSNYISTCFLFNADEVRYGELLRRVENDHVLHGTPYPATLTEAYNVLINYVPSRRNDRTSSTPTFLQTTDGQGVQGRGRGGRGGRGGRDGRGREQGDRDARTNDDDTESVTSTNSGKRSKSNVTAYPTPTSTSVSLHQVADKPIPKQWIILDSASSIDLFVNPELLTGIQRAVEPMQIISNAGSVNIRLTGSLEGYPETVWYHPQGAANVLSLRNVTKHFRVTLDSQRNNCLYVHVGHGIKIPFQQSTSGLYYYEMTQDTKNGFSFLTTVTEKKAAYTQRGIQQAQLARRVQDIIMHPSSRRYMDIVSKNFIRNCPIERRHIQAADDIYGPNVGALRGKTPRQVTEHVTANVDPVPPEILALHRDIVLAIDIMFINKIAFLITISRGLRIGSIHALDNRQVPTIRDSLRAVLQRYQRRGFRIQTILADDEFQPVAALMSEYAFNLCGADEHVPDVERYIRTTKDTIRSRYNELPFEYIPRSVLIRLAENAIFWQNAFPHEDSVSPDYSPRYLIEGRNIDYTKHVRLPFGAYVQTHEIHDNTMTPRTISAICLGPSGNEQGTHYFLSLVTGRVISRPNFTELPMPDDVIRSVSELGRQQLMPRSLTFGNRYGQELTDEPSDVDDAHDSDYDYSAAADDETSYLSSSSSHSDHDSDPDDSDDDSSLAAPECPPVTATGVTHINSDTDDNSDSDTDDGEEMHGNGEEIHGNATETGDIPGVGPMESGDIPGVGPTPEGITGVKPEGMNLRPRRAKGDPTHLMGRGFEDEFIFLTAQMSAKKGLQILGRPGADAIIAELQQVHYRKVVKPVLGKNLTTDQKRAALHYLMFLKQKRCGRIKARGCADGRKQRMWKTKEETSSPTVRTESVFISAIIDAMERRAVITCDIPGAFMQADIDELIHVKFEGEIAELLVKVDPKLYSPYVVTEHGKKVIYVQLQKALYGTLQAALLFWKELSQYLTGTLGFKINPYDTCVANKIIDGKQCTVLWHVDDLKISHVDPNVLEDILDKLNQRFGKEQPLTVTRGTVHDYLGMKIDYSTDGKAIITMIDYIDNMLDEMPEDMQGSATSPAASYLFDVNPKAIPLDRSTSDFFHATVAKLLYLGKRARPDLLTAIAFLSTRVSKPDVDDYGKLRRCMRYLRSTRTLPLVLEGSQLGKVSWWVDASYAVHPDMRSHTGAIMTMGGGTVSSMSTRQKINTRSSTEAELVGVDDAMSGIVWTRNFLMAQGVHVSDNVVYQDNMSAILLEKNGQASCGKRTRHINIRYFFIKDRVAKQELRIEYCPTEDMLSDLLTKPLQGSQFRKLRDRVLNIHHNDATTFTSPAPQECVETSSPQDDTTDSIKSGDACLPFNEYDEIGRNGDVAEGEWFEVKNKKRRNKRKSETEKSHTLSQIQVD